MDKTFNPRDHSIAQICVGRRKSLDFLGVFREVRNKLENDL
jgi:hypothetical protein